MTIMIPAWQNGALQPVEKLMAHQLGLKHRAVSIFVMAEDHILIQQRALSNITLLACGRIAVAPIRIGQKTR